MLRNTLVLHPQLLSRNITSLEGLPSKATLTLINSLSRYSFLGRIAFQGTHTLINLSSTYSFLERIAFQGTLSLINSFLGRTASQGTLSLINLSLCTASLEGLPSKALSHSDQSLSQPTKTYLLYGKRNYN